MSFPGTDGQPREWDNPLIHSLGCLGFFLALVMMCVLPWLFLEAINAALQQLHMSPSLALAVMLGIVFGSFINIPVYRFQRETLQPIDVLGSLGLGRFFPQYRRMRVETVIAVNFGGCLVPLLVAIWEVSVLFVLGGWPLVTLVLATAANILACYLVARPMAGVGIAMPGWVSPLVVLVAVWLLLPPGEAFDAVRPPVAFVAGVLGPLVGADLLHLKDISRVSTGLLSIGGAGTFDGIVLSAVLATLVAGWHPLMLFTG